MSPVVLGVAAQACVGRLPEPVPVPGSDALASRYRSASTPEVPRLIGFRWTYRGRQGRFSGDGGVRVNPPDSVRIDLLGPGSSGVQSAVLVDDRVGYIGEQRVQLPPPTFLWALFGIFRPPRGEDPRAFARGDYRELVYRVSVREEVMFRFDVSGHLVAAERRSGGRTLQRIELTLARPKDGAPGRGWVWPREARFRDLRESHEVRVEVTGAREHKPFESAIFRVAAR